MGIPGLFGFKLISTAGAAVIGLILTGGLAMAKISYDNGVRAQEREKVRIAQEEFNQQIAAEAEDHAIFIDRLYRDFQSEVSKIERQVPQTDKNSLPICPADCRLQ